MIIQPQPKPKPIYSGSNWLIQSLKITDISPLGIAVADLLGDVFLGIYHLNVKQLRRVEWSNKGHIVFNLGWRDMSTIDNSLLTVLVVLAHDRMIRVEISASTHAYLRIIFHQRTTRTGSIMECCPTIEEHVRQIHQYYYGQPDTPGDPFKG